MKIGDIKGESRDSDHLEWIEVSSFSWGISQPDTPRSIRGGSGPGRVSVQDISFRKRLDKSSPLLMKHCATGDPIPNAVLHVARTHNDKQTYMEVTLSDLLVSSYSTASSTDGSSIPSDEISLNFSRIEMAYSEIDCSTNRVVGRYEASHTIKF